ncbi:hypothetical protein KBY96_12310 [Cyanobium sp. ATX 6A2]|nr:hypothetical protein [Cyanobium sp. ATX 6A2]
MRLRSCWLPVGDSGQEERREAGEMLAGIPQQYGLATKLPFGPAEDRDRVQASGARALVEIVATVAVKDLIAANGLEHPVEELRSGRCVLGDQQHSADCGVPAGGV